MRNGGAAHKNIEAPRSKIMAMPESSIQVTSHLRFLIPNPSSLATHPCFQTFGMTIRGNVFSTYEGANPVSLGEPTPSRYARQPLPEEGARVWGHFSHQSLLIPSYSFLVPSHQSLATSPQPLLIPHSSFLPLYDIIKMYLCEKM